MNIVAVVREILWLEDRVGSFIWVWRWVWQSVSVSEVVVCWTDGGWRLGDGVSWRMGRRWRQIVVLEAAPATSSIIKIYHWFMVDKLGGTGGTEAGHRGTTLIEDSGVVASTIHRVLDSLKSTVGKSDVIDSSCPRSVTILRVTKLVTTVVVFDSIGESVIFSLE